MPTALEKVVGQCALLAALTFRLIRFVFKQ